MKTSTQCQLPYLNTSVLEKTRSILGEWVDSWVHSHAHSIRSHWGTKVVWPDFQPMSVPEEPVWNFPFMSYRLWQGVAQVWSYQNKPRLDWKRAVWACFRENDHIHAQGAMIFSRSTDGSAKFSYPTGSGSTTLLSTLTTQNNRELKEPILRRKRWKTIEFSKANHNKNILFIVKQFYTVQLYRTVAFFWV
jgi:hypothetical protein